MSLSESKSPYIEKLTRGNYPTWIEKVRDYIMALEHDDAPDIYHAFEWVPAGPNDADPADHDYQAVGNSASAKKLRVQHNKAYQFIRNALSSEVFDTTVGMPHSVPKLLRHLRSYWNDGSVTDRNALREEYLAMRLENYDDFDAYAVAFKNKVRILAQHGLGLVSEDEDVCFQFFKGLPQAWNTHKGISQANKHTFTEAASYLRSQAKNDPTLPGALKSKAKSTKAAFIIDNARELSKTETCRRFAQGRCTRGDDCRYAHPSKPTGGASQDGHHRASRIKCDYCGKPGHKKKACFKKKRDDKNAKDADSTNVTSTSAASTNTTQDASSSPTPSDGVELRLDGMAFMLADEAAHQPAYALQVVLASKSTSGTEKAISNELLMVLDGASTTGVVQDEAYCVEVKTVDKYVKTGGQGQPNLVHCRKEGILPIDMMVDGKRLRMRIPVKIIPGFGVNILPECIFLKKGLEVTKKGAHCQVLTPGGDLILRAEALHHESSWLFYVRVRLTGAGDAVLATTKQHQHQQQPPQQHQTQQQPQQECKQEQSKQSDPSTIVPPTLPYKMISNVIPEITFIIHEEEGERELQALFPLLHDFESCHATRASKDAVQLVLLWHKRLGHPHYKLVADVLGIPLPSDMPKCISCLKSKSKRRPLTGGGEALHDGIRTGYAWGWDHAGPFPLKTWGGNNYFSLKIDVYSGKIFGVMTNTTGTCFQEWSAHVLQLERHFGRPTVARLITDSAPYFDESRLASFNAAKGIIHMRSPPYTQELNGLTERTLGTLLGMVRTALDYAAAPERSYGECMMAMCETLDRQPHKRGGKLTRLEKWRGRLLPRQHDKLRAWGCAAYLHLDYGKRGTIGKLSKLDPRAELYMLVGYDPNGMGYRIASLPGFNIRTALHVTFVEDFFPCRTSVPKQVESFMTPEQQERARDWSIPATVEQEQRPRRGWQPSALALENLATGNPTPPDAAIYLEELGAIYPSYDEVVMTARDCPTTIPEALAGLEAEGWRAALDVEVKQHEKNKTFGAPVDPKDLPPGVKPIHLGCVLNIKRSGLKKVRGIIKGFRMTAGIDFNETFAPVPCISVLRFFFALAAKLDWEIKQGDVHTAFLCSDMDAVVYAAVPNWFKVGANGSETGYTIRRLLKGVPGIPQGSRLFHKKCQGIFSGPGVALTQCKSEFCLYFCSKRCLYLIVWVDDLFFFFPTYATKEAQAVWKKLQEQLDLDDWQDIDDCLACTVRRDRANRTLSLTQQPAVEKLLLRNDMQEANAKETPMTAGLKLSKAQCPTAEKAAVMTSEQRWYRSTVATLLYFNTWTRPDLAYAISKLCKFMQNPGAEHIIALKRLLRYVKGTRDYGLRYDFSPSAPATKTGIYGYYDAAHADCPDTYRSTMAHLFYFFGCPLSWKTKLHSFVTTSTNHSEYCAAAKAAREAKWWETTMVAIGFGRFVGPIDLFSDSKGAIAMTYNPVQRAASKHVDLADHYAREQQERGTITISHVGTKDMRADILTKPLAHNDFARHAAFLVHRVEL